MSESINDLINALTTARLFLESSRARELQMLVQDPTASADRFLVLLAPSEVAAMVLHARESDAPFESYESLPMRLQEDAKVLHILVHEKIPEIAKHPALEGFFEKWYASLGKSEGHQKKAGEIAEAENREGRITGIAAAHLWIGNVGELEPFVNLRFRDNDGDLLLESIASLPDVIFLTSGLIEIVNSMVLRLADAHEKRAVNLNLSPETRQFLSKIYQQAHDLEQALSKLIPSEPLPAPKPAE